MTIGDFEKFMNGIADVVFCDDNEKKVFKSFIIEVNRDVFELHGDDAVEEYFGKKAEDIKESWKSCVGNDSRLVMIGNRIFDCINPVKEAFAYSYGG